MVTANWKSEVVERKTTVEVKEEEEQAASVKKLLLHAVTRPPLEPKAAEHAD